eukprot:209274_1
MESKLNLRNCVIVITKLLENNYIMYCCQFYYIYIVLWICYSFNTESRCNDHGLVFRDSNTIDQVLKMAVIKPKLAVETMFEEDILEFKISQMYSPAPSNDKPKYEELQLVIDHYKIAQNKNIEQILLANEPHIIQHKNKIYAKAKKDGITYNSDDIIRLKVLSNIIEYIYNTIEPPNEYTKKTDIKHHKEVAVWSTKFAKNKGIIPPLTLIYASWAHDLERWIPSTKCEYLPESVDKYRKRLIHGITSARIATYLLKDAPVTKQEIDRVYQLILYHDTPNPRDGIVVLGETLMKGASDDLMWELELLMDADAISFFESTIIIFILYKSEENSKDWIWERVRNNVKRLREHLKYKAVKYIYALPDNVKNKMSFDYKELAVLCPKYKHKDNGKVDVENDNQT